MQVILIDMLQSIHASLSLYCLNPRYDQKDEHSYCLIGKAFHRKLYDNLLKILEQIINSIGIKRLKTQRRTIELIRSLIVWLVDKYFMRFLQINHIEISDSL
jgi:hypothetical protein